MVKKYKIYLYDNLPRANIYVTHCQEEKLCDFEQFLTEYGARKELADDVARIVKWISRMGENGVLERYFRPEGRRGDQLVAIPVDYGRLRLYCIRLDDNNLIIGGGGMKTTRTYQEAPDLYKHVIVLQQIDRKIRNKIAKGLLILDVGSLNGIDDVCFDVNVDNETE